jgi:hypothetical protein
MEGIFDGTKHQYRSDILIRLDDSHVPDDLLTLIVEATGEKKDNPPKSPSPTSSGCLR